MSAYLSNNNYFRYDTLITKYSWRYKVPKDVFVMLMMKETLYWDPHEKAPWSSAVWLWMFINDTWVAVIEWKFWADGLKIAEIPNNRFDPEAQIWAIWIYLSHIMKTKAHNWKETVALYNMWKRRISKKKAQEFAVKNIWITRFIAANHPDKVSIRIWKDGKRTIEWIENITGELYFEWAVDFYSSTQSLA